MKSRAFRIALAMFVVGCDGSGPFEIAPERCTIELESGCWTLLGLEGAKVTEIAATPWGVFVGTHGGGLFRLDPDRQWHEVGPSAWRGHVFVSALAYVPTEPPRLLAGMRSEDPNDSSRAAVYASFDQGRSWVPAEEGLAGRSPAVSDLGVDPGDPQRVFLSNSYGVMRSLDAGETWEFVLGDFDVLPAFYNVLLFDPDRAGRVWTGGQTTGFAPSLLVSHDSGESWNRGFPRCNSRIPQDAVTALALDPNRRERLWIGMIDGILWADSGDEADGEWKCGTAPRGVFVTGLVELAGGLYAVMNTYERVYDEDGHFISLDFFFGPLYRTSDGGDTWDSLPVPGSAGVASVGATAVGSRGRVLVGTDSGVWALEP